jgi:hypothetical protein
MLTEWLPWLATASHSPDGENARPSGSAKPCQISKQGEESNASGESERLR